LQHNGEVRQAVFHPDGTRILTASYDKTARLWHADDGKELQRFSTFYLLDSKVVSAMFPQASPHDIATHWPHILASLIDANLVEKKLILLALAIIRAEVGNFTPSVEHANQANTSRDGHPFDRYDYRLGNRGRPDGENFRGRGFILMTGRANYLRMSKEIGLGAILLRAPELASRPSIAARVLAGFMKSREKRLIDALSNDDIPAVWRSIVGGHRVPEAFIEAYQKGVTMMQAQAAAC
jgi:peptidoglycan L-alanyl-D-glutamate endopeptidase CwlK